MSIREGRGREGFVTKDALMEDVVTLAEGCGFFGGRGK